MEPGLQGKRSILIDYNCILLKFQMSKMTLQYL